MTQHPRPPLAYRLMQAMMWPLLKLTHMTCETIFRLSSEKMDRKLTPGESLRLRLHLMMCGLCRRLPIQFRQMRKWICAAVPHEPGETVDAALPAEAKARMANRLKEVPPSHPNH